LRLLNDPDRLLVAGLLLDGFVTRFIVEPSFFLDVELLPELLEPILLLEVADFFPVEKVPVRSVVLGVSFLTVGAVVLEGSLLL
jgi:hypothetical protein